MRRERAVSPSGRFPGCDHRQDKAADMPPGAYMKKILHILRRESAQARPYWEDFYFETQDAGATVATALSSLHAENRISPAQDSGFRPVLWEHSCLQKRCGACSMIIDGVPALACDTRLSQLKGDTVRLEPLRKFPVVADLLVDRSVMMENLKDLAVWLEAEAGAGSEDMAFEASRCLQCGLCLEICPNFAAGGSFSGMAAMAPLSRLIARLPEEQRKQTARNYKKGVYSGCGKSLACRDVCPAEIKIDELLVKSNAAAVWNRWNSIK